MKFKVLYSKKAFCFLFCPSDVSSEPAIILTIVNYQSLILSLLCLCHCLQFICRLRRRTRRRLPPRLALPLRLRLLRRRLGRLRLHFCAALAILSRPLNLSHLPRLPPRPLRRFHHRQNHYQNCHHLLLNLLWNRPYHHRQALCPPLSSSSSFFSFSS